MNNITKAQLAGMNLRRFRNMRGYTQEQLSEKLLDGAYSSALISKYEKKGINSINDIEAISQKLGIDLLSDVTDVEGEVGEIGREILTALVMHGGYIHFDDLVEEHMFGMSKDKTADELTKLYRIGMVQRESFLDFQDQKRDIVFVTAKGLIAFKNIKNLDYRPERVRTFEERLNVYTLPDGNGSTECSSYQDVINGRPWEKLIRSLEFKSPYRAGYIAWLKNNYETPILLKNDEEAVVEQSFSNDGIHMDYESFDFFRDVNRHIIDFEQLTKEPGEEVAAKPENRRIDYQANDAYKFDFENTADRNLKIFNLGPDCTLEFEVFYRMVFGMDNKTLARWFDVSSIKDGDEWIDYYKDTLREEAGEEFEVPSIEESEDREQVYYNYECSRDRIFKEMKKKAEATRKDRKPSGSVWKELARRTERTWDEEDIEELLKHLHSEERMNDEWAAAGESRELNEYDRRMRVLNILEASLNEEAARILKEKGVDLEALRESFLNINSTDPRVWYLPEEVLAFIEANYAPAETEYEKQLDETLREINRLNPDTLRYYYELPTVWEALGVGEMLREMYGIPEKKLLPRDKFQILFMRYQALEEGEEKQRIYKELKEQFGKKS